MSHLLAASALIHFAIGMTLAMSLKGHVTIRIPRVRWRKAKAKHSPAPKVVPIEAPAPLCLAGPPTAGSLLSQVCRDVLSQLPEPSLGPLLSEWFDPSADGYRDRLMVLEAQLRETRPSATAERVAELSAQLVEAFTGWQGRQQHFIERYQELPVVPERDTPAGSRWIELLQAEQQLLARSVPAITEIDPKRDPSGSCGQLLAHVACQLAAAHGLRDQAIELIVEVGKHTGQLATLADAWSTDELTGLASQLALHHSYAELEAGTTGVMALVDVNACARLNEKHGPAIVDGLLQALAMLTTEILSVPTMGGCLARLSGNRLVLIAPGADLMTVAEELERLRESVVEATFSHRGVELRPTITPVVATFAAGEPLPLVLAPIEEAMRATKGLIARGTYQADGSQVQRLEVKARGVASRTIRILPSVLAQQ